MLLAAALSAITLAVVWFAREVFQKEERARREEEGRFIAGVIQGLIFDCIWPGYRKYGRIEVESWCQRKWLLFGEWMIVLALVHDPCVRVSHLENIVADRISRLLKDEFAGADIFVKLVFIEAQRRNSDGRHGSIRTQLVDALQRERRGTPSGDAQDKRKSADGSGERGEKALT